MGLILGIGFLAKIFLFGGESLDFSGKKKVLVDDNGLSFAVESEALTVGQLLEKEEIFVLGEKDEISPAREEILVPGTRVEIKRALEVEIAVDGEEKKVKTLRNSVRQVLDETEITLGPLDKINYDLSDLLESGMEIEITRINKEEKAVIEEIDFETVEKEDDDLDWKKKKVKQEGEKGEKEIIYEITYTNGKETNRKKISSKVVKKPVDEIVVVGTKIEVGKTVRGKASWYAYTGTMACASVIFPKGTWLRVTNLENGKQVIVVVNDYGPDPGTGKIIDLDKAAFEKIMPLWRGTAQVKIEEIIN